MTFEGWMQVSSFEEADEKIDGYETLNTRRFCCVCASKDFGRTVKNLQTLLEPQYSHRKCTLSPSERERILRIKAEMEGEIQALEKQIYQEKLTQIARGNRSLHMNEGLSSTGIYKPHTNLQKDGIESHPTPLQSERQMLDALQFEWFQSKNPLENWTVGSLPSLRDIRYAREDNTGAQQNHFYREH